MVVNIDLLRTTAKPAQHLIRYIPLGVAGAAESGALLLVQRKISLHHLVASDSVRADRRQQLCLIYLIPPVSTGKELDVTGCLGRWTDLVMGN